MDALTDAERARLAQLKLTARQREPLPDVEAMEAAMRAACATLGTYLCDRGPESPLGRDLSKLGDFDQILITLLVFARAG